MKRILCIGNRYDERDDAGPRVYDRLARAVRSREVGVIDGGLAGLDLLRFATDAQFVVCVGAVPEDPYGRDVVIRTPDYMVDDPDMTSGLAALLRIWPRAGDVPPTLVVGVCGAPIEQKIISAADWALNLVRTGCVLRFWQQELAATG